MTNLFPTRAITTLLLSACVFAVVAASASGVAARSWLNNVTNAGHAPADNQKVAMSEGRWIAGYGGECLDAEGGAAIRRFDGAACLDVYKSQIGNGTPVIYFRCNGDANQQWGWR